MGAPAARINKIIAALALLSGFFWLAPTAQAACSNPSGNAGDIIYNGDDNLMSYCDDTNWIGIRGSANSITSGTSSSYLAPTSGLVGHWTLDENTGSNINDSSASNIDGTWEDGSGDDVSEETVAGQIGTALNFDGIDDSIDVGQFMETDVTLTGWFKADDVVTPSWVLNFFGSLSDGWGIVVDSNTVYIRDDVDNADASLYATPVSAGTWYHVAAVMDGLENKLYINGALVGSGTSASDTLSSFGSFGPYLWIGVRNNVEGNFFDGSIDDVRVYDRALDDNEIAAMAGNISTTLVGHWRLDETSGSNINDSSGNGNDGTWSDSSGNDVAEETNAGIVNRAINFDGSNDYIDAGSDTSIDDVFAGGGTIAAWIYPETHGASNYGRIASKANDTTAGWHWLMDGVQSNAMSFHLPCDAGGWVWWKTASGTVPLNQWSHVALSFDRDDGANNPTFYVNGQAVSSAIVVDNGSSASCATFYSGNDSGENLLIGQRQDVNRAFDGNIDDLRIYNSTLSAESINDLYIETAGTSAGLVSHWKLDETSGQTITDYGSAGNDGDWEEDGADDLSDDTISGRINTGIYIGDSSTDKISIPDDPSLNPSDITYATWFKPEAGTSGVLLRKAGGTVVDYYMYYTSSELFCVVAIGSGAGTVTISGGTIKPDTWQHGLCTFDGDTNEFTAYLDGVEVDSTTVPFALQDTAGGITLGARPNDANQMSGILDDVRIYNRVLSAEEIAALAAACQEGDMIYNKDHHVPQYCAGEDNWVAMGPVRGGIDNGMLGHWKLDETGGTNIQNEVDNVDGTFEGDTAVTTANGRVDSALSFDGGDDAIRVPSSVVDDVTDQLTFALWAKSNGDHSTWAPMMSQQSEDTNYFERFSIFLDNNGNDNIMIALTTADDGFFGVDSGINMNDRIGEWLHIAGVYNGKEAKIYVNGVQQNAAPATGNVESVSRDLIIGGGENYDALDQFFGGDIDDARVYNRALSDAEILALYELGNNNDASLIAHWKLDEGAGTTVTDSVGSADGTLTSIDGPTEWSWGQGPIGGALRLTGFAGNDYVDMGAPPVDSALEMGTSDFSLSIWFKTSSTAEAPLFNKRWMHSAVGYYLRLEDTDGDLRAFIMDTADGTQKTRDSNTSGLNDGNWHHVVAVFDRDSAVYFYIDGVLDSGTGGDITTEQGTITDTSVGFQLGSMRNSTTTLAGPIDGFIDDARIYSRVISAEEATALYKMGIGNCTNPVGKEGDLIYNDDAGVDALQYCDGAYWQMIGKSN